MERELPNIKRRKEFVEKQDSMWQEVSRVKLCKKDSQFWKSGDLKVQKEGCVRSSEDKKGQETIIGYYEG